MLSKLKKIAFAMALAAAGASSQALAAGQLVVGGDITGLFNLQSDEFQGIAGNRAFFANVGGDASHVAIYGGTFNSFATQRLDSFYRNSRGLQVDTLTGEITTSGLANFGLVALVMPDRNFTGQEKAALHSYVSGGGRLLLLGEASQSQATFPVIDLPEGTKTNIIINDLLAGIGSAIRLDNNTVFGANSQRTTDVRANPLTAGVTEFGYGYVSSVSGGEALFGSSLTFNDVAPYVPFFATEQLGDAAVPEPASWAMMIAGFALAGAGARRSRKIAVSFG